MITHRLTIFEVQTERLGTTLILSVLTHGLLIFGFFFLPGLISSEPVSWGEDIAGGGAMSVGIVQNVRGLNLPSPELTSDTTIASESKGLGQTEAARSVMKPLELPDPKSFEIEDKKKAEPKREPKPAKKAPPPQVAKNEPKEVVPFGEGGNPNFNYSQFSGPVGSGGIGVGDGIFGQKYGWYVRQIRDIVSRNWLQNMVDPNVRSAPRVFIQFEIQRDGTVFNEFVKQSSGIPSLDRSGLRAIRASRFPPLPGGETRLTVEFYFEYSR
jgi:periplasmic protein TonB